MGATANDIESQRERHVLLEVEIPVIYTADLEGLREYQDKFETESEWLLNCLRICGVVRLRVQVEGDKDSDVTEVWGSVLGARLIVPSAGVTDESLAEAGQHELLRDEHACEWCATCPEAMAEGDDDDDDN